MASHNRFLPYGRHCIEDDDLAAVADVLRSEWLTTGPAVERFEHRLRERLGVRHVVSCANGTAALHMAVAGVGLRSGELAIVPTMTFLATANAARYAGGEVVFSDVNPDSGLMEVVNLEEAVERAKAGHPGARIRVVLPVHLNGQAADVGAMRKICDRVGAALVVDASHALGTVVEQAGREGQVGDCRSEHAATFSFHPVKAIAMGEGGAVTTNDPAVAREMSRFRNHGMTRDPADFVQKEDAFDESATPNPWYYEMPALGYNYRASDLHCALAESQLSKLERFIAVRRTLADRYDLLLKDYAPVVRPVARVAGCRPAWHLYVVLIDFQRAGVARSSAMKRLRSMGIGTQVHYFPVHRQPYYRRRYGELSLPGAEAYYRRALSLPLFAAMVPADVDRVVAALGEALGI